MAADLLVPVGGDGLIKSEGVKHTAENVKLLLPHLQSRWISQWISFYSEFCLLASLHIMETMSANEMLKERLRRIYSEIAIEHILHPRNVHPISNPDGFAEIQSGHNECLKIWLRVRKNIVTDSGFWTNGCAATIACGSMSTELVKGKTVKDALALTSEDIANALVDLPDGNFHCAELAASALKAALADCLSTQQQPWKKLYRK